MTGKSDIRNLKLYNQIFGKKCLFIETPNDNYNKIINILQNRNIKKIYLLTPINYEFSLNQSKTTFTRKQFEEIFKQICKEIKKHKIEVCLHVHIKKDTTSTPYKDKFEITKDALNYIQKENINVKSVGYGWWRFSHKDPELHKIAKELKLKLNKREPHIYDFWLK